MGGIVLALAAAASFTRAARSGPEPTRLRDLYGLPRPSSLSPPHTALVLVDFQNEFVTGGLQLPAARTAITHATELVRWARRSGTPRPTLAHARHRHPDRRCTHDPPRRPRHRHRRQRAGLSRARRCRQHRDPPPPRLPGEPTLDAPTLQRAALATLSDRFAEVLHSSEIVRLPLTNP